MAAKSVRLVFLVAEVGPLVPHPPHSGSLQHDQTIIFVYGYKIPPSPSVFLRALLLLGR